MRAHLYTMAHATVRTIEIGRLSDHAEHGFMPKDKTISAAAAGLWVATHKPARTILLLKNVTSRYIAWNPRYKDMFSIYYLKPGAANYLFTIFNLLMTFVIDYLLFTIYY